MAYPEDAARQAHPSHERLREFVQGVAEQAPDSDGRKQGLKRELREARSELTSYERASYNTLGKLLSSVQYAVNLYEAGDKEAAEKLSNWMERCATISSQLPMCST